MESRAYRSLAILLILMAVMAMATLAIALPVKPGVVPDPQMVQLYKGLVERSRAGEEPGHPVIKPTPPVEGPYRGVVLLVDFNDVKHDPAHTVAAFDNIVFNPANPNSVHSFYIAASSDVPGVSPLTITGEVGGWYELDRNRSYYTQGVGGVAASEPNCATVLKEAVLLADDELDFSDFDANGDGYVDAVWVVAAGETWQETGSSEDFATFYATLTDVFGLAPIEVDGVKIDWFMFGGENEQTGAFAHELGHNLGLLDMYDVSYQGFGLGIWSLMGAGSWNGPALDGTVPSMIDGYNRRLLGWVRERQILANATDVEINRAETSKEIVTLFPNGDELSDVFFLLENRQRIGFDTYLPGDGLAIYRVDQGLVQYNYSNGLNNVNADPTWYGVDLLQSDGAGDLYDYAGGNWGDGTDLYPAGASEINGDTTPNTDLQGDVDSNVAVSNISASGSEMTFDAQVGVEPLVRVTLLSPSEDEVLSGRRLRIYGSIALIPEGTSTITEVLLKLDDEPEVDITASLVDGLLDYVMDISTLAPGLHTILVTAKDENDTTDSDDTTFELEFKTIDDGLQLLGVPYDIEPSFDAPAYVFAGPDWTVKWDAGAEEYDFSPDHVLPGMGYWVRRAGPALANIEGAQVAPASFTIDDGSGGDLVVGWHMIACPFNFAVDWGTVLVQRDTEIKSVVEASAAGWIKPTIYWYEPGSGYDWDTAPDGVLRPWYGYWVRLLKPCKLIVLPAPSGRSEPGLEEFEGWKAQLMVSTEQAMDRSNYFGVAAGALDGSDDLDVLEPPMSPLGLGLAFTDLTRSGSFAQDIKSAAGLTKEWLFTVASAGQGEQVTVSWPNLASVPREVDLVLVDQQTGERRAMRTSGAYTFTATAPESHFSLVMQPTQEGALAVTGLAADTADTKGSASLGFDLSSEAYVTVKVYNLAGSLIKQVATGQLMAQGHNELVWTGLDEAGRPVSNGTYAVEVQAVDAEGRVVRASRTFVVLK